MERTDLIGPGEPERVRWTLDIVQGRVDLPGLRVLELACRTGAFSTAFANAGATVLGIEGRQDNLDHVPPSAVEYRLDDVRNLSVRKYGKHDVTLCLGILYHLDAAEAIKLLRAMRRTTERFAVVDTHVGDGRTEVAVGDVLYRGSPYQEVLGHPWSALDTPVSWWFAEDALEQACYTAGWNDVEWIPGRSWHDEAPDRRWLVIS